MNHGSTTTVYDSKRAAFSLPTGLDCPPPRLDFTDDDRFDRLDDDNRFDRLDDDNLSALELTFSAADVLLFADPAQCAAAPPDSSSCDAVDTASPRAPPPHSKKASRKQVHELQGMVDAMQVQVNGAAAEIHQLTQLVGQFAQQRAQERRQHAVEQQQRLFEENEMDMDLGDQQRHLQAQVQQEREQFMREQQ
ncbi:unnamed protein product [Hyaloperonospora brassicae]|uniref:Uncharacterized protein n=1 Tax=Hyaloperonospora brassicae TaxID=162125 RepID=A0AAV0U7Q8_HYABA|nr:unnamed protein product [Hyaloperonospora brassicae]